MNGKRACIFGATGGVGRALTEMLADSGEYEQVFACGRTLSTWGQSNIIPLVFDLMEEASIQAVARRIAADGLLDLAIVATGILHRPAEIGPEKSWRALDPSVMAQVFAVNTIGPAMVAKHILPGMRTDRTAVFAALSARVGSIEDNRLGGWHSYRASKAALNMLMRNLAIELGRRNPHGVVVSLHPGTVDTRLSYPFQSNVPPQQLMSPRQSAGHLLRVIAGLAPEQSGQFYAWDGESIPF